MKAARRRCSTISASSSTSARRIAIVGPSGSGKSTLLNLILRLYMPDEGRVAIDGVDVRKVTLDSLRRSMAVVFQENMLFNMSIRENIRLGKEGATDEEVEEAAKKAEIHRYIMSLPQRYDTPVGERGDTLSGGQRQRIAIARAVIRNPSVLLLDEATSALDQTTEAAINRTLLKVAEGPHHDLVDPSPDLGGRDGRDHRDFRGQGDRARLACRAARQERHLSQAVERPDPPAAWRVAQADDDSDDDDEDEDDLDEDDEDEDDEEA